MSRSIAKKTADKFDFEKILSRIEGGESQREIAASYKVSVSTLNGYINADDKCERSALAREMSAESWLDRGLDAIESALSKSGDVDPSAARAYAQECARRAAVRNPKYRDKVSAEISGPNGGPIKSVTMTPSEFATIAKTLIDQV